jgi:hypothetical protein
MRTATPTLIALACAAAIAAGYPCHAAEPADEPPPSFTAAQLLSPAELRGPHHTVTDAVQTDGYYHEFRITSDFGKVDAAGSIAMKVILPIPGVVGMTATVSDPVWSKDPEELRKINEQRLRDLGVPGGTAQRLFRNSAMALSDETRLIAAQGWILAGP